LQKSRFAHVTPPNNEDDAISLLRQISYANAIRTAAVNALSLLLAFMRTHANVRGTFRIKINVATQYHRIISSKIRNIRREKMRIFLKTIQDCAKPFEKHSNVLKKNSSIREIKDLN